MQQLLAASEADRDLLYFTYSDSRTASQLNRSLSHFASTVLNPLLQNEEEESKHIS